MIRFAKNLFLILCILIPFSTTRSEETFRFAVTDIEGLENLQREYGEFKDALSRTTGFTFEFYPVSSRTAAVEALKSRKLDFALTGPAEYVIFRKRTDAYPVVAFSRPDYFSSIIVLANSGINSIKDLKGKKVAFGDIGSTSKHLAPMQLLKDYGLDPLKDIKAIHVSYKIGWEALKKEEISAFATTNDKFLALRSMETEPGAFRVIARSPDLPNDVLLAGKHISKDTADQIREAFNLHSQELIKALLKGEDTQKYRGTKFLTNVKDSDYNYIRSMYATIGYPEYSDFIGAQK
jgi:phosphonate transport system substrate-binding protein